MISRNKGILSRSFGPSVIGLIVAVISVGFFYLKVVRPRATELQISDRVRAVQNSDQAFTPSRSVYIIIKDAEQAIEGMLFVWATIIVVYKLRLLSQEGKLLKHDYVRINQGERIIPDDALDRYKDLRTAVDRNLGWRGRLLPEAVLAALHRFHSTHSIHDASSAVKEHAELAADNLDSDLSLVRYIAWAIPAVGFIGTVRGIGDALAQADQAIKGDISGVTSALGLAFNSTLVALMLSMVLMYLLHMLQSRQEGLILDIQNYCREKLIDRMKVPSQDETSTVLP